MMNDDKGTAVQNNVTANCLMNDQREGFQKDSDESAHYPPKRLQFFQRVVTFSQINLTLAPNSGVICNFQFLHHLHLRLHKPWCWPGACAHEPEGTWQDSWHALEDTRFLWKVVMF